MMNGAWVRVGPDDEDDEVNHDPDSWWGEDCEDGFDDMPSEFWADETLDDDGFDDAGPADDDEDDEGEGEEDDDDGDME